MIGFNDMKKITLIGHCIFLIIYNWIILITIKSDTMYFKGVIPVEGIGRYAVTFILLLFIFYLYINQFYLNVYRFHIKEKSIIKIYFNSPLFVIWMLMNLYLLSIERLMYYVSNFKYFIFVYIILCGLLICFQKLLLIKLEKGKIK